MAVYTLTARVVDAGGQVVAVKQAPFCVRNPAQELEHAAEELEEAARALEHAAEELEEARHDPGHHHHHWWVV